MSLRKTLEGLGFTQEEEESLYTVYRHSKTSAITVVFWRQKKEYKGDAEWLRKKLSWCLEHLSTFTALVYPKARRVYLVSWWGKGKQPVGLRVKHIKCFRRLPQGEKKIAERAVRSDIDFVVEVGCGAEDFIENTTNALSFFPNSEFGGSDNALALIAEASKTLGFIPSPLLPLIKGEDIPATLLTGRLFWVFGAVVGVLEQRNNEIKHNCFPSLPVLVPQEAIPTKPYLVGFLGGRLSAVFDGGKYISEQEITGGHYMIVDRVVESPKSLVYRDRKVIIGDITIHHCSGSLRETMLFTAVAQGEINKTNIVEGGCLQMPEAGENVVVLEDYEPPRDIVVGEMGKPANKKVVIHKGRVVYPQTAPILIKLLKLKTIFDLLEFESEPAIAFHIARTSPPALQQLREKHRELKVEIAPLTTVVMVLRKKIENLRLFHTVL